MHDDTLEMMKFFAALPEQDPLGGIENMRRNLSRALSCVKDGKVVLFEDEINHWIAEIDKFLQASKEG